MRFREIISSQTGFGLAEVVVSAGVLSVIALGMASLTEMASKGQRTTRIIASRDDLKASVDRFSKNFSALKNSALNPAITDPGNLKFRSCLTGIPTAVPCDFSETPFVLLGPLVGTGAFPQSTTAYSGDFDQNGAPCSPAGPNCPIIVRTTFTCPDPCAAGSQVFQIGYSIDGAAGTKVIRHIDTVGRTFEATGPNIQSANPSGGTADTLVKWDASGSNFGSSQVIEDSQGRVGIGTDTPLARLHVSIASNGTSVGTGAGMTIQNRDTTPNNRAELQFSTQDLSGNFQVGPYVSAIFPVRTAVDTASELAFYVKDIGGGSAEALRINRNYNVGIGTSDPQTRLDILNRGSGIQPVLRLGTVGSPGCSQGTGSQIGMWAGDPSVAVAEVARIEGLVGSPSCTNGRLNFYTGNQTNGFPTLAMTINGLQDVGIGGQTFAGPPPRLHLVRTGAGVQHGLALSNETSPAVPGTGSSISFWTGIHLTNSYEIARIEGARLGGSGTEGALKFYTGNSSTLMTLALAIDNAQRVGIGTATPAATLDVNGVIRESISGGKIFGAPGHFGGSELVLTVKDGNGTTNDEIWIGPNQAGDIGHVWVAAEEIRLVTNQAGSKGIFIGSTGNVGIGTSSATHALLVLGTAARADGVTSWDLPSDIRLKDLHGDYQHGLEEVLKLHTIRYNYKKDNPMGLSSGDIRAGFIAQEVREVIPEAVHENSKGYLELNVDPIHWAVVNAVKQLKQLIDRIYERLLGHDQEIARLTAENDAKSREIASLKEKSEKAEREALAIKSYLCAKEPGAGFCK